MLSPASSSKSSSPSSRWTVPRMTTKSSSESPCAYCSRRSSPRGRARRRRPRGDGAASASTAASARESRTQGSGDRRAAARAAATPRQAGRGRRRQLPSASAIRRSEATLALARPRSTWLRKLSLRPGALCDLAQRLPPAGANHPQPLADVDVVRHIRGTRRHPALSSVTPSKKTEATLKAAMKLGSRGL